MGRPLVYAPQSEKVCVSMPAGLLDKAKELAPGAKVSHIVQHALLEWVLRHDPDWEPLEDGLP